MVSFRHKERFAQFLGQIVHSAGSNRRCKKDTDALPCGTGSVGEEVLINLGEGLPVHPQFLLLQLLSRHGRAGQALSGL